MQSGMLEYSSDEKGNEGRKVVCLSIQVMDEDERRK